LTIIGFGVLELLTRAMKRNWSHNYFTLSYQIFGWLYKY